MNTEKSPLSFEVDANRLPAKGISVSIVADDDQRAALAAVHDIEAVRGFTAELLVAPWRADGIHVTGRIQADIVQTCIVTLEPLASTLDLDVDIVMVPEGSRLAKPTFDDNGEMVLSAEGADPPDTFSDNMIDVGAHAEEHFALAIDPYPRKADAILPSVDNGQGDEAPSPFSKLADWRPKQ